MCLITLAIEQHDEYPLVMLANRDEFFQRPSNVAEYWSDFPDILAGRDQEKGGTWCGLNRLGSYAAITNVHGDAAPVADPPSRGLLITEYLTEQHDAVTYLNQVVDKREQYAGFNLLVGKHTDVYVLGKTSDGPEKLSNGIHVVSNAILGEEWPKAKRSKQLLRSLLDSGEEISAENCFRILSDTDKPDDSELKGINIDLAWRRKLSSIFVSAGEYGTRASTILLIDQNGQRHFYERGYDQQANIISDVAYTLSPA